MYKEENLAPTAIARILDAMKIPTKKQGKKWDHSIVIDILKREGIYIQSRKSPQTGGSHGKNN
ncbi:MAG: recombinase family protein [Bdellovibrionales bacterium]|nr:recombinase family protein [Bdellovibrionales bacterium]